MREKRVSPHSVPRPGRASASLCIERAASAEGASPGAMVAAGGGGGETPPAPPPEGAAEGHPEREERHGEGREQRRDEGSAARGRRASAARRRRKRGCRERAQGARHVRGGLETILRRLRERAEDRLLHRGID